MFDPVNSALRAASVHSAWAVPAVFAAGAFSSAGPCIAPRFIAAASLTAGKGVRESVAIMVAFVSGLTVAYASFGVVASEIGRAVKFSTLIFAILATALACAGTTMLCRTEETHCTTHVPVRRRAGFGGSFLLGASFALVLSPCCTPLVIVILAYTSTSGDPWYGSALLAIFAVGHALPLLGIGAGAQRVGALLARPRLKSATSTAAATLMLSLAAYYAVLA